MANSMVKEIILMEKVNQKMEYGKGEKGLSGFERVLSFYCGVTLS